MLDVLRANARSVLTYVLFGIIIVVFVVSFGPGSRGCSDGAVRAASYAAKVNGEVVTAAEFEQAYAQLFRNYQSRLGRTFTRELAEQLGLRSQALHQLIDRELVIAEAARHSVVVTNDDIDRAVKEIPSFQVDGKFNMDVYRIAVSNAYGSPAKFEERLRGDLAYQKMLIVVRQSVNVPEEEVKQQWQGESDRVNLEVVRFPLSALKGEVKVSDAEVRAFAAADGPRIEKYYQDNPARYQKKKRIKARHILVRLKENASQAEDEAAKKKVEGLAERVRKGEDFGKLAAEFSEDPGSKDKGGDLGFFGEGVMAKPFEDAAFSLAAGQVSGPVRTRFGWHLIQVEEVQPAQTVPLAEARDEIARDLLLEERARALGDRRAEEALAKAKAGRKLADLFPPPPAAGVKDKERAKPPVAIGGETVSAEETGPFTRNGEVVPKVGSVPGLAIDAFAAEGGAVLPKVYHGAAGPIVAVVKERQRPDPAKFAERRGEIADRLRGRREGQVETAWLKGLRQKAEISVNEAFVRGEVPRVPLDLE